MKFMKIDPLDPLRCVPEYRRILNKTQWACRYRGIAQWYFLRAYRDRNPYFVEPYIDEQGNQQ